MEDLLREILAEMKSTRKLLEGAFGVQASSIQQLGVVEAPAGTKKFSISQNDDVMLEQENPDGSWSNSSVKHICGYLSGLDRWNHEYKGKPIVYLSATISADVPHNIRSNVNNVFSRMLVSLILEMTGEQLANVLTLTVVAGSDTKTVRMPEITDSFGLKLRLPAIKKDDWDKNAISYVDRAIAKIKAVQLGGQALGGASKALALIASSPNPESPERTLRDEVVAQAKSIWGENYKDEAKAHSATHFGGLSLKEMSIEQLNQYLDDLEKIKKEQKNVA
jgi:hypothetical protein